MLTIGYDIGSSSIKASLYDVDSGEQVSHSSHPKAEMQIQSSKPGWAEQDPQSWWDAVKVVTAYLLRDSSRPPSEIAGIGITYQMHGLVIVDRENRVLRPSIIWCDSRAVEIGDRAFKQVGEEKCLNFLLNSPGNFTASKLKWVIENEKSIFDRTFKFMLPGDYIAMKLTGEVTTTAEGLSEGVLWNFVEDGPAEFMMEHLGIGADMLPEIVPTFGDQGKLSEAAASELGLKKGTPVTYRAGDQPNNAFSLNVLRSGEVAATAGTSGVVYGVSDQVKFDRQGRVNTFAHVNHSHSEKRLGILLCINGTGISYNWIRKMFFDSGLSYEKMNESSENVRVGSDGLIFLPFGNGAERILGNRNPGASFAGLDFNKHTRKHLIRSVIEGVGFSFYYGMNILKELSVNSSVIRAGMANMFLSSTFRETISTLSGTCIQLYNTDSALGAARGAAYGAGLYHSFEETFSGLRCLATVEPNLMRADSFSNAFDRWLVELQKRLK